MLQHNNQRTHVVHAVVVGLHALCCGVPVLALVLAALWGTTSAVAAVGVWFGPVHSALHSHELWIVAVSAVLVATGGLLEWTGRRGGGRAGFPWLFGLSVGAFVVNLLIVVSHQA